MTAFDYLVLGILVVSAALGLFRGLIKEVLSLVAYIAAFVLTIWLAPKLSLGLEGWVVNDLLRLAIAYASVFALALLGLGLINLFLSRLVDLTGLGTADHALGALFGVWLYRTALRALVARRTVIQCVRPSRTAT